MTTKNNAIVRAIEVAAADHALTDFEFLSLVEIAMGNQDCSVTCAWDDDLKAEPVLSANVSVSLGWIDFRCRLTVKTIEDRERVSREMAKKAATISVSSRSGW